MTELSRRRFLAVAGAAAVGAAAAVVARRALPGGRGGSRDESESTTEPPRSTSATVPGVPEAAPGTIAAVGVAYLRGHPEDRDGDALAAQLSGFDPASPATLAALADRIAADVDAGEVVAADGWMLSRTEARAAALVALRGAGAPETGGPG